MSIIRYANNWKELSKRLRIAANYRCEKCGLDCLSLGRRSIEFDRSVRQRYSLQVHHWDRNPANNRKLNLAVLCNACHLSYHRGGMTNLSPGQLSLALKIKSARPAFRYFRRSNDLNFQLSLFPLLGAIDEQQASLEMPNKQQLSLALSVF
jgi:hypothetical protein